VIGKTMGRNHRPNKVGLGARTSPDAICRTRGIQVVQVTALEHTHLRTRRKAERPNNT